MRQPPDRQESPGTTTGGSHKDSVATKPPTASSLTHGPDHDRQDALGPLVDLALELRPSLPYTVAQSLVTEALAASADLILCERWARARQALYPQAVKCSHNRHVGQDYERRRAAECAT
jgi:hypothetical protein